MTGERSPERLWAPRFLLRVMDVAIRKPRFLVALGVVALVVSVPFAAQLYMDLRTDLRELLPRGAPAARALDSLERRLGGTAHLSIVVETDDPEGGRRFVDALGSKLSALAPEVLRDVRYRTDEERAFFDAHGALYASTADLRDLNDGLRAEVERAKREANPLYFDLEDEPDGRDPRLDRAAAHLRSMMDKRDRFPSGYIADEQEHAFVLLVTPTDAAVSLESNKRLLRTVEGVVQAVGPTSYHPSIRIGYGGEVRDLIEAQDHLVKDLVLSSALVLSIVSAAIVLFYGSFRAIFLLSGPLFVGACAAYAASRFAIGYLNPNTAFVGAVIIGNGINPGILLLARFLEEKRHGCSTDQALVIAVKGTWLGTFTACAAAAAGYASLRVAGFRGFNQFAFMGGVGMIAVWLSTYVFMPPLIVLADRRKPLRSNGAKAAHARIAKTLAETLVKRAVPVALGCTALAVVSAVLVVRFVRDPLEYDFTKLGSRQGRIDGSAYWGKRVDSIVKSYVAPTVILTSSEERAVAVAAALRSAKRSQGPGGEIDRVMAIDDVVPPDQPTRINLLQGIFDQVTPRVLSSLSDEDRALVEKLKKTTVLAPITLSEVPDSFSRFFREKDGQVGRLVLVYPTLQATAEHGRAQLEFARSIRSAARSADPEAEVAGGIILMADVIEAITRDGAVATVLSFAGVALLTILLTRALRDAAWIVGALCLGTLWMGGAFGALGLKMNFANFVVLPITFGIGVDYAVNLYQRYKQAGSGRVTAALSGSGSAVALCSLTTIIGYGALLVADYQAVFSFGLSAVIGEIACLASALLAMPAFIAVRDAHVKSRYFFETTAPPPSR
jgi:predicted RND superfamily exporter protein